MDNMFVCLVCCSMSQLDTNVESHRRFVCWLVVSSHCNKLVYLRIRARPTHIITQIHLLQRYFKRPPSFVQKPFQVIEAGMNNLTSIFENHHIPILDSKEMFPFKQITVGQLPPPPPHNITLAINTHTNIYL